jgi:hypothetical protein
MLPGPRYRIAGPNSQYPKNGPSHKVLTDMLNTPHEQVPWAAGCAPGVHRKQRNVTYLDELYKNRMGPKVTGLATWSENCKWYSSLPLDAVVPLFCESV